MERNHVERCKFCVSRLNGHVLTRCLKNSKLEIYIDYFMCFTASMLCGYMKIPIDIFRTHNRNRSLSFINSDQLVNVNKGSRHIRPVTLEKRLALIVGHRVNLTTWVLIRLSIWIQRKIFGKLVRHLFGSLKNFLIFYLPLSFATTLELFTDKKNPTV